MQGSLRARAEAVADLFETAIPDGAPLDDGGPSARRTVAMGLAAMAVQVSGGEAASTFAAFRSRLVGMMDDAQGPSRVQRLLEDVVHCRRTLASIASNPHKRTHGVNANTLIVPPTAFANTVYATVVMSHADGTARVLNPGERVDTDRLRLHANILAATFARRGVASTADAEAMLQAMEIHDDGRVTLHVPHEMAATMPAFRMAAAEINHGSLALFARRATDLATMVLEIEAKIETIEKVSDRLMDEADRELARRGLPMRSEMTIRRRGVCNTVLECHITLKALGERLMMTDHYLRFWQEDLRGTPKGVKPQRRDLLANLDRILADHARRLAKMRGEPTDDPARIDLDDWKFDSVILAHAARRTDPEAFLREIVANHVYGQDEGAFGRLAGDETLRATVRIQEGEATIRTHLSNGILWSHGTVTINQSVLKLPEQLIVAMKGRRIGEIIQHPLLDPLHIVANASVHNRAAGGGTIVVQTKRVLKGWDVDVPLAA